VLALAAGGLMVIVLVAWGVSVTIDSPPVHPLGWVDAPAIAKLFLPLVVATWAIFRSVAAFRRRPLPRTAQWIAAASFGVTALVAYYDGIHFDYSRFLHRHDQYHLYLGTKYFPELGYTRLYRCTIVAESELEPFDSFEEKTAKVRIDPALDARRPDRKIRDLDDASGYLVSASTALEVPEKCKSHFDPQRWSAFKTDVRFFRGITTEAEYWFGMQKDSGYPRSPVWHLTAHTLASLGPATLDSLETLAWLDVALVMIMFAAVAWAFGIRVAAFGAVIWGCQAIAPWFWTGGGFLEALWVVALVIATCLARKRKLLPAGIVMAYAALLSPVALWIGLGWVLGIGIQWFRKRTISPSHRRIAVGGAIGLSAFLLLGAISSGFGAYGGYVERERISAARALTNDMGLEAALSHDFGGGVGSGRMQFAENDQAMDPFAEWRAMRKAHFARLAPLYWILAAGVLASLVFSLRRARPLWISGSLAQALVVVATKAVSWKYWFLVLSAPLIRRRQWLEIPICGFLTLSQIIFFRERFNDDKYAALSLLVLAFTWGLVLLLTPPSRKARS
jgi:hypothetical protein